jgi:hypothetical protein
MAASAQSVLEAPPQPLAEAGQVITLTEAAPAGERHMWAYACARIDSAIAQSRHDVECSLGFPVRRTLFRRAAGPGGRVLPEPARQGAG